jgi:hypothetical protein
MESTSIAKLIAVPSAFLIGGYHLALSHTAVPALYDQAAVSAVPAFSGIYFKALQQLFLPTAAAGLVSYGYLTYQCCKLRTKSQPFSRRSSAIPHSVLYGTAAGLVLGVGLVTKFVLLTGVERLLEMNEDPSLLQQTVFDEEVRELLYSFVGQNWWRAAFGIMSGIIGLYAIIDGDTTEEKELSPV